MYQECRLSCRVCEANKEEGEEEEEDNGDKKKESENKDADWKEFQKQIRKYRFGVLQERSSNIVFSIFDRDLKKAKKALEERLEITKEKNKSNYILNQLGVMHLVWLNNSTYFFIIVFFLTDH